MNPMEVRNNTYTVVTSSYGPVQISVSERGTGRPFLVLHGGAGPQSVTAFADLLAGTEHAQVIVPSHPGFSGTDRPEGLVSVAGLAELYTALLETMGLSDLTIIGNSLGGWIAAEMGLLRPARVSSFILVDAVGIQVEGHPVADFFALTLPQVAQLSYFNPDKFRIDPTKLPPAAQAVLATNRAALAVYAGKTMGDPGLVQRLAAVRTPTLVVWGESDRIVDVDYGRALAAAIPGAQFTLLRETGHLPQIESPEPLVDSVWKFALRHAQAGRAN